MRKAKRPGWITAFAVLEIIVSAVLVMGSLLFFAAVSMSPSWERVGPNMLSVTALDALTYVLVGLAGFVGIAVGVGLLKLREWARQIMVALAAYNIITSLAMIIIRQELGSISVLTASSFLYNGLKIWFFTKKEAKAFFK